MVCKMTKLSNTKGGTARILVILSVLILILVGIMLIPTWKAFRFKSECIGCEQAMDTATDGLRIEYLNTFEEGSVRDARKSLDEFMPAREDICPSHGNVYLIRNDEGIIEPVCGLHNKDAARRTRLNASYAGSALEEARKNYLEKAEAGDPEPEKLTIRVNSKPLDCTYVTEEVPIRRGTRTTKGYKGVVAFYGTGDNNKINYFVYADEDYIAIWHEGDGWRGTAYDNL